MAGQQKVVGGSGIVGKPALFKRADDKSNFKRVSFEPKGRPAPDVILKPLWNSLSRIVQFAYFTYVFPLLTLGSTRVLELEDLYQLAPRLKGKPLVDRVEAMYARIKADQTARRRRKEGSDSKTRTSSSSNTRNNKEGGLGWAFLW